MVPTTRSRGHRAGLTVSDVLGAAGDVVRVSGPEALSMRSVAARLGVAPNALYSYVAGKDALVDALLDERLRAIPDPDLTADPAESIRACMLSTFDVLVEESQLVPLYLARQGSRGPRATELGAALETLLQRAGVEQNRTRVVVRVLVLVTIGIAAQAASEGGGPISTPELRTTLSASITWIVDGAAAARP